MQDPLEHPSSPAARPPRPYRESLAATLRRTLRIAAVLTTLFVAILALAGRVTGSWGRLWLTSFPAILWFPLGGHYVELAYLNVLRMRFPAVHRHARAARIAVWFVGGLLLGMGMWWTWRALGNTLPFELPWWWGMPAFVFVEFIVHGLLHLQRLPNFWDGRE